MNHGLLTQRETEMMRSESRLNYDNAVYLASELPRKGDGFFEKFMFCLCESIDGTGHKDIIRFLTVTLDEVKRAYPEGTPKVCV